MNANQVVILMDRDHAAKWLRSKPGSIHEGPVIEGVRAALDRDPAVTEDRLVKVAVEAFDAAPHPDDADPNSDFRAAIRAVLHALQEGTEK